MGVTSCLIQFAWLNSAPLTSWSCAWSGKRQSTSSGRPQLEMEIASQARSGVWTAVRQCQVGGVLSVCATTRPDLKVRC
ncbi:unnamed protein product [Durusdinium trenchii]|uniref:Secreted protein n=1 Tax=Durusdinium trenchii TaxID=1381693 RepID=A0ABP0JTK8_9DINO